MFATIRALTEAVLRLKATLDAVVVAQRDAGPAEDRLMALELSRAQWEADLEGLLSKAEGRLKAANNAENRERTMRKSYEKLLDPLGADFEEEPAPVRPDYAPPSEEEGVQPVRVDVATDYKAIALNRKFG